MFELTVLIRSVILPLDSKATKATVKTRVQRTHSNNRLAINQLTVDSNIKAIYHNNTKHNLIMDIQYSLITKDSHKPITINCNQHHQRILVGLHNMSKTSMTQICLLHHLRNHLQSKIR